MNETTDIKDASTGNNAESTGRIAAARDRAADLVDTVSTRVGSGLDAAAKTVASTVGAATDNVGAAGEYLQERDARQLGADIVQLVRRHPKTFIAVGVGLGFLVSRMLRR